jgi:hypothetical protein
MAENFTAFQGDERRTIALFENISKQLDVMMKYITNVENMVDDVNKRLDAVVSVLPFDVQLRLAVYANVGQGDPKTD